MGTEKYIGRIGALAVALGIGAALAATTPVAFADDQRDPVQVDTQKAFGPVPGQFSATGAIDDSGTFTNLSRTPSAFGAPNFTISHLEQEFVGEDGSTFIIRSQIKETATDDPLVLSNDGHWVLQHGTGIYEGTHGQGTVTGTSDDPNNLIIRTYTGQVRCSPCA